MGLLLLLLFVLGLPALAQLRLDVAVGGYARLLPGGQLVAGPRFAGGLEFTPARGPWRLTVQAYPSWNAPEAHFDPGLARMTVGYATEAIDVEAGLARHPLATAQLLEPYRLPGCGSANDPNGCWSAWVETLPRIGTSLKLALLKTDGGDAGLARASLRWRELELHLTAVYGPNPAAPAAAGLGASERLGRWIVYGEGWWLPRADDPARGALGASTYLGGGLLTLEAGYVDPWTVAGAYSRPIGEDGNLDLTAGASLAGGEWTPAASGAFTYLMNDADLRFGVEGTRLPGVGYAWGLSLDVRAYY